MRLVPLLKEEIRTRTCSLGDSDECEGRYWDDAFINHGTLSSDRGMEQILLIARSRDQPC